MNEQELREMVRESIARRLGSGQTTTVRPAATVRLPARRSSDHSDWSGGGKADTTYEGGWGSHPSHLRLPLVSGDEDGACVIEPAVRCNHCGYCLSLGH